MRKSLLCAAGLLAWSGATLAQDAESPHQFSGTIAIVSDYVFRGVSQSDEDPAFQASYNYEHASGFYAGVWASTVDFDPSGSTTPIGADVEVDVFVGYGWAFNDDWAGDVSFVRYLYPGTNTDPDSFTGSDYDLDYSELIAKIIYRDMLTASVGYSNDVFNSGQDGTWVNLTGNWELPAEFVAHAGVGVYSFDGSVFPDSQDSYLEWHVGVSREWGPVAVDLTYFDTDGDGEELFGELAEGRVAASVTYSF